MNVPRQLVELSVCVLRACCANTCVTDCNRKGIGDDSCTKPATMTQELSLMQAMVLLC